jgi:hypothetical protein
MSLDDPWREFLMIPAVRTVLLSASLLMAAVFAGLLVRSLWRKTD